MKKFIFSIIALIGISFLFASPLIADSLLSGVDTFYIDKPNDSFITLPNAQTEIPLITLSLLGVYEIVVRRMIVTGKQQ